MKKMGKILTGMKEENPFEDPEVAKLWITSVEGETGGAREKYIYPLLRAWLKDASITILVIGALRELASLSSQFFSPYPI